jgi:tryptophan-rich sensory protein
MLAISIYTTLATRSGVNYRNIAIALFAIQMVANLMWPSVFNDAKYLQSLLLIVVMVVFTIGYAYLIYEENKIGSMLVWPYIVWVSFAGIINTAYYFHA